MVVKIIIGVVLLIFSILLALGGKKNCDEACEEVPIGAIEAWAEVE